jgi:hypothetical protein
MPQYQVNKNKTFLHDTRLTWKARGIMAYLVDHPHGWTVNLQDILAQSAHDGRSAIQTAMQELIKYKYARLEVIRDAQGRVHGKRYSVYQTAFEEVTDEQKTCLSETPTDRKTDDGKNRQSENLLVGKELYAVTNDHRQTGFPTSVKSDVGKTRSIRRVDIKKETGEEEKDLNPSVLSDDKTSPQRLTPTVLMAWYNEHTPETLPKVQTLSPARRTKAEEYLRMFPDAEFWRTVFAEIGRSAFLQGLKPSAGHDSFKANFDWLLSKGKDKTENCVKVAEGQYRDREHSVRDQLSDLEYRNLEHMHNYLQENAHGPQPTPRLHD